MKKKAVFLIYPFVAMGLLLMVVSGCKKDEDSISITDFDGNVYTTVTIGTQVWMVENLKTTHYNDGVAIPIVNDSSTTAGYCWYNNDIANKATFGALYNWYTINNGKLAPLGWHVPNDDELQTLIDYLGGYAVAGGKLKEAGTKHWNSPNEGATNESGFTALPGGYRQSNGEFTVVGYTGLWMSCTKEFFQDIFFLQMLVIGNQVTNASIQGWGIEENGLNAFSIRCVKD